VVSNAIARACSSSQFYDSKIVATGDGREVTRVQASGLVRVQLQVVSRGLAAHGYTTGGPPDALDLLEDESGGYTGASALPARQLSASSLPPLPSTSNSAAAAATSAELIHATRRILDSAGSVLEASRQSSSLGGALSMPPARRQSSPPPAATGHGAPSFVVPDSYSRTMPQHSAAGPAFSTQQDYYSNNQQYAYPHADDRRSGHLEAMPRPVRRREEGDLLYSGAAGDPSSAFVGPAANERPHRTESLGPAASIDLRSRRDALRAQQAASFDSDSHAPRPRRELSSGPGDLPATGAYY
jgi:hypothetical protein